MDVLCGRDAVACYWKESEEERRGPAQFTAGQVDNELLHRQAVTPPRINPFHMAAAVVGNMIQKQKQKKQNCEV